MQFSTLLVTVAFAAGVIADTHYNAICVDDAEGGFLYNAAATEASCNDYMLRNAGQTGLDYWETCADCKMTTNNDIPFCNSAAGSIGGKEITAYCKANGAKGAET
ncbi:hypothetical protein DL95DRAFT_507250 [Leptodontidium sp. 2 PMI_412]|nr:hypothetical protein BKA61DRAFT_742017 [Leptodontidium sp. MPI-SDFR-AT-0119]KAH9203142.1 hypothetical protein DL95DRAFT_507250 [Leptodontidium sp. 2 PMI_412]